MWIDTLAEMLKKLCPCPGGNTAWLYSMEYRRNVQCCRTLARRGANLVKVDFFNSKLGEAASWKKLALCDSEFCSDQLLTF